MIRPFALSALLALAAPALAPPALAQDADPDCTPFAPGCDRLPWLFRDLERDFGPLFRDLEREVVPRIDGLGRELRPYLERFGAAMEPYLADLAELLGDLTRWEAPEVLPNGDILIRRRPAPSAPEDQPEDSGPVTTPFEL